MIDKERYKNYYNEYFNVKNCRLIFYKNPNNYKKGFIEDINGGKDKIVYGRRWNDKKQNYEKIIKIFIPSYLIFLFSSFFVLTYNYILTTYYVTFSILAFIVSKTYKVVWDNV